MEFAVSAPVTVKSLLTVVVPVAAPIDRVVAAPAKLRLVALVFKILAVAEVVVISPPLTAKSPLVVTLPVNCEAPSIVNVPLA